MATEIATIELPNAVFAPQCPKEFGTAPDCDCPWEHWHVGTSGMCLDVHIENDGSAHITLDWGDDGRELQIVGKLDLAQARHIAFAWVSLLCSQPATTDQYLIWSNEHRCWWAPEERGYTQCVERAGRYSRTQAIDIAGTGRGGWSKGQNPGEIAILEADAVEQSTHPRRLEAWESRK